MSKPATIFEWASNPAYNTGAGNGSPTKVNPAVVDHTNGFMPLTAAVPQHMNWLIDQIRQWVVYVNGLATDSEFLANSLHFTNNMTVDGTATVGSLAAGATDSSIAGNLTMAYTKDFRYSASRSYKKMLPLSSGAVFGDAGTFDTVYSGGLSMHRNGSANNTGIRFFLDLPVGAQLTAVRAGIHASGQTPASGSRLNLNAYRVTYNTVAPSSANTIGSSVTSTATAVNAYAVLAPVFGALVDSASHIILEIGSNISATIADPDVLLWVELTYSHRNPDPSNHL